MKSPSPSSSQHGIVFTPPSTFHSSSPFSPSVSGSEEPAAPPPPEVQAEPSIYRVRDILDSRRGRPHRRRGASGAAPGGGGTVRESQSPPTTLTRSQSPDY